MPALDGMRILDLTQYEAGTSCTQMLAWLGAEVVKVEQPGVGDPGRHTARTGGVDSLYFLTFNGNKRSLALNLRSEEGRAIFLKLLPRFDVVTENFTLGTMERLGLGYETLKQANPAIIYATLKGFGTTGPYKDFKSFDMIAQAAGGAMSITGYPDREPIRSGATFGDTGTGMTLAMQILAAYIQRLRTGEGQMVEASMQEAVSNFVRTAMTHGERVDPVAPRRINRTGAGGAPSDLFPCAPGGANDYVYIHVNTSHFWDALCIAIDRPELADDPRFATAALRQQNLAELHAIVSDWTKRHTKWEAMEHLGSHGLPAGAVFDTLDLLQHPHLVERGAVSTIEHPTRGTWKMLAPPFHMSNSQVDMTPAPLLGQHTDEVLAEELGLSSSELDKLADSGVTGRAILPSVAAG
jgi:formyl-CoA transferase